MPVEPYVLGTTTALLFSFSSFSFSLSSGLDDSAAIRLAGLDAEGVVSGRLESPHCCRTHLVQDTVRGRLACNDWDTKMDVEVLL